MIETVRLRPIVFVWDNFGVGHADRAEAVAVASPHPVVGVELAATSADYDWTSDSRSAFEKITLHDQGKSGLRTAWPLIRTLMRLKPEAIFFCHYERTEILIAAIWCRLAGIRVLAMSDSKLDNVYDLLEALPEMDPRWRDARAEVVAA